MNPKCRARVTIGISIATVILLSGCLGRSQPTKFYLLQAIPSPQTGEMVTASEGVRIGIGPIQLPEYLDRPQIVTRIGENEHQLDEFNQWAENLTFSIARVLGENLSILLSTDNIFLFPWKGSTQIDYQVKVGVIRFSGTPGGNAVLDVLWTIYKGNDAKELLDMKKSSFSRPTGGAGYEALVSAQNKMLEDFSREIAGAITALPKDDVKTE